MHRVALAIAGLAAVFVAAFSGGLFRAGAENMEQLISGNPNNWQIVEEYKGQRFVMDSGLSTEDCTSALPHNDVAHGLYFACERP